MSRWTWLSATLVALIGVAAAAEPREIVLWPEGVPEPRLPAEPAESVEKKADGIARRANVSNPRLVVYDIPRADGAAAVAATNPAAFPGADQAVSPRPDALLLLYAWQIVGEGNRGLRSDIKADAVCPPTFIAQCGDDKGSVPQGSANLYLALLGAGVPAEIHIYEQGGHGFGLKAGNTLPGQLDWKARAIDWLRGRGW